MDTSTPLSVLAVDDNPEFAELTATFLRREDALLGVQTAHGATDALERLADSTFDCIVSDYDMPGKNGLALLEEVRSIDDAMPFILFTGKGSEEVASEAISAGVSDYLQKDTGSEQYTLLVNRIRNCVAQYRAERERQLTIDRMTDAIIELDEDWRLVTVDSRAEAIYEMDADELLGQNVWDAFPEAVDTRFYDVYHEVMETREPATLEEYYEDLATWVEAHVYPALSGGLSIYFRDISARMERTDLAQ